MGMSPTQLTLRFMRGQGYVCGVTERWNSFAKVRQDLLGFIDVLCVGNGETVAVQSTSDANVASRVKKIASDELAVAVSAWRKAGNRIVVQGWKKAKNGRWTVREIDVS